MQFCRILSLHACAYSMKPWSVYSHTLPSFLLLHTHIYLRPCVDICQTDLVDGFCLLHTIQDISRKGMEQFYILTVSRMSYWAPESLNSVTKTPSGYIM